MRFVAMCQALDGDAPIHIKWFKDQRELRADVSAQAAAAADDALLDLSSNEELGSASIVFRRVEPQHAGNYTCLATNHFGSAAYSSLMSVKGEHLHCTTAPLITAAGRGKQPFGARWPSLMRSRMK